MKKIITKLLIGAFIMCVIISCKKGDGDTPQSQYIRIKKITPEDTNGFKTSYEYDSKGRVIKLNMNGGIRYYEYSDYDVKFIFPSSVNPPYSCDTTIFLLNPNGLAKSSNAIKVGFGWKYEYDNNGYLIKSEGPSDTYYKSSTRLVKNTILDGNISVSNEFYIENDTIRDTITYVYEYYKTLNTIGLENVGISYLGKQNRNLRSKEIRYHSSELPQTIYYTYEFDNFNRVVKLNLIQYDSSKTTITLYTYY